VWKTIYLCGKALYLLLLSFLITSLCTLYETAQLIVLMSALLVNHISLSLIITNYSFSLEWHHWKSLKRERQSKWCLYILLLYATIDNFAISACQTSIKALSNGRLYPLRTQLWGWGWEPELSLEPAAPRPCHLTTPIW